MKFGGEIKIFWSGCLLQIRVTIARILGMAITEVELRNSFSGVIQPCKIDSTNTPLIFILREFVIQRLTMTFLHIYYFNFILIIRMIQ